MGQEVFLNELGLFRVEAIRARSSQLIGTRRPLPRLVSGWVTIAIALLGAAAMGAAMFVPIGSKATMRGEIVNSTGMVQVRASAPGQVQRVFVSAPAGVTAGAPLVEIGAPPTLANGASMVASLLVQNERSLGLLDDELIALRVEHRLRVASLQRQLAKSHADLGRDRRLLAIQRGRISEARHQVRSFEQLVQRGFGSRSQLGNRRDALASAEQQQVLHETALAEHQLSSERIRASLAEEEADVQRKRREIERRSIELRSTRLELQGKGSAVFRAPANGRLLRMELVPGQAVEAGDTLALLTPPGSPEGKFYASPSLSPYLRVGDKVQVTLDAYPYQRFGTLEGEVTRIDLSVQQSSDRLIAQGAPLSHIAVSVKLFPSAEIPHEALVAGSGATAAFSYEGSLLVDRLAWPR